MTTHDDGQPVVIELRGLVKRFGYDDTATHALSGVDLRVRKGEFVAVMGPSGCGKSTLLHLLGLLDNPTEGDYYLDGIHVDELNEAKRARTRATRIGFVFQSFNLLSNISIIENVALPLTYSTMRRSKQLITASNMLRTFELQEREYYMPHQLSGGQLQRVAIARALVNRPSILLADEPTGNLDSKASELIMNELREIHARGNTIIMVTHNPDLTVHATRIITMRDGQIAHDTAWPEEEKDPLAKRPLSVDKKKPAEKKTVSKRSTPETPVPVPEPERRKIAPTTSKTKAKKAVPKKKRGKK